MTKITDGAGLQAVSPGMGLPAPEAPPFGPLLLLMALTALGQMATNLVVPSLATMAADLSLDPGSTGLILSAVLVGIGLGQLVVGPMSDRYGRRPVLLAGLGVYVLGGIAATLAPSGAMLLSARLLQGLGASAGLALPRAIARDRYAGATFLRAMSALTLAMAVMPGLAPVLGGMIAGQYGWRASLAVSAASGILVAAVVVFALPESHHSRSREGGVAAVLGSYRHVLRRRVFLGHALATGAVIGGAYAEVAASQRLFGATFGWAPTQVGLASSSYALSFLLGGLLAPRLRIGHRQHIRIGIGMVVLSPLIFLALSAGGLLSAWSAMAVIMLSQAGVGFMMPPSIALGLMAVEGAAGTSSAVMGAIHMVTGALGAALVGAIAAPVVWGLPGIMLGFALLALCFATLARPPR